MSSEFDERQEVIERKEGYSWSVSVQLGKSSERVKARVSGHEDTEPVAVDSTAIALQDLKDEVKKAHEELTEEKDESD